MEKINDPSVPDSNLTLMVRSTKKLKAASDTGSGVALTNDEVKAVLFMLRTLKDGVLQDGGSGD